MIHFDEEVSDLQYKNLKLIQKKEGFRFGTDAVLLSLFASVKRGDKVIDLCSGSGIVPVLLLGRTKPSAVYGVEILPEMAEMANRSQKLNNLENLTFISRNLIDCHKEFPFHFDVVTCNPPYMKKSEGKMNETDEKTIARHEIHCTLEDCVKEAGKLLKCGGKFSLIHRADRLVDCMTLMRSYHLEPKRLQMVHPAVDQPANLILIEGKKDGKPGLLMEPPIYMYDQNGKMKELLKEEEKR